MKDIQSLKKILRPYKEFIYAGFGFFYDLRRFYLYSGWFPKSKDVEKRNYKAVKYYHSLEKSLSYRNRKEGAGWGTATDLIKLLKKAKKIGNVGFQEKIALNVIEEFCNLDKSEKYVDSRKQVASLINDFDGDRIKGGGTVSLTPEYFVEHALDEPEKFFLSRYSVRDFSDKEVNKETIERALQLSLKTPSVCNRQAWHVYQVQDKSKILEVLKHQLGCVGFEHEVPCLFIITTDLKAFDSAGERYQHWIDGGLYSMSLILAFHALGLSSCCLNWSRTGRADKQLRKMVSIKREHTVIMMLAVGYPKRKIKVCASERRPLSEFFTKL